MINSNRIPPQNIEAEEMVLGCALIDLECAEYIISGLVPGDFYSPLNASLMQIICKVGASNSNLIGVLDYAAANSIEIGGAARIATLSQVIPSIATVKSHVELIKRKHALRAAISLSMTIIDECYTDNGLSIDSKIDDLEKIIYEARIKQGSSGFQHISEILPQVCEKINNISCGNIKNMGLPTGYDDIDFILNGLCGGDLVIIAARPSMGKTSLALNIIENLANDGIPQAFFSLEMNQAALAGRLLSSRSKIDNFKIMRGGLDADGISGIGQASDELSALEIYVDDTSGLSPSEIRSRARRLCSKHKVGAIWIDYLQLCRAKARSKEEETSIISGEFKAMAKELNVPVIALSQLSRACESRNDKRPMLSDLRDSGSIEQDADVVAFIYRDDVYNKSETNPNKGVAEIIIGKQRNGPTGTVELVWRGGLTRFDSKISWHRKV